MAACILPVFIFGKDHRILARNGCSAPFGDLSTALKRFRVSEPEEAAVSCITRVLRPKNAFRKFFLLVPAPTARAPEQARAARTLSLASPRGLDWSPFWPPLPPRGPPTWVQAVPPWVATGPHFALAWQQVGCASSPPWSAVDHGMTAFASPLPTISSPPWSSTVPRVAPTEAP